MPNQQQFRNPFYVIVLLIGILFLITTCGYAVLAVRGINPTTETTPVSPAESPLGRDLMAFLDTHGVKLMLGELAVLGAATVAAIATDQYWMRQAASSDPEKPHLRGKEL